MPCFEIMMMEKTNATNHTMLCSKTTVDKKGTFDYAYPVKLWQCYVQIHPQIHGMWTLQGSGVKWTAEIQRALSKITPHDTEVIHGSLNRFLNGL